MADTKDVLVSKLREWMKIENEMKQLQAEVKSRRERKKQLTADLVDVMKENDHSFTLATWASLRVIS